MTVDRINEIVAHVANRLDDANEALILNVDTKNRVAEIIDEEAYERDGIVIVWGYLHYRIQGHKLYLWCDSIIGGGIYRGTVSLEREQDVEDDLIEVLGRLLHCIQHDYVDEGP